MSSILLVTRTLWMLYTDANTRFNLLIDECAHLQETIDSLLPNALPSTVPISGGTGERTWIPTDTDNWIRDADYYLQTPQQRALRNLWMTMGGLATALEENKCELRRRYRRTVVNERTQDSEAIYWFLSLRGHFLTHVFPRYLDHLQHAHEKLVQLIENMPGALPGPTLLRRWSSGGYGEFLSEYSRNVNQRAQELCWRVCVEKEPAALFEEWRKRQFLVHTWSHRPTSSTWLDSVNVPQSDKQLAFTTIWSSYFYLEQPILFPLLFHECAHHLSEAGVALPKADKRCNDGRDLWVKRPAQTAALLQRAAKFESLDHSLWRSFIDECWADAVSIALCGEAYVVALSLQIVGIQGDDKSFSDYDVEKDAHIALDELGSQRREIRAAQYPSVEQAYFWEARLELAMKTLSLVAAHTQSTGTSSGDEDSVVAGLKELIERWRTSGAAAMAESVASRDHADYWSYRERLNKWLVAVVWGEMEEFARELAISAKAMPAATEYALGKPILKVLRDGVDQYQNALFGGSVSGGVFDQRQERWQIEDVCAEIRWRLSKPIVESMQSLGLHAEGQLQPDGFGWWAERYADYMRSDGSVAFRLALEWCLARKDVIRTAARVLIEHNKLSTTVAASVAELTNEERTFFEKVSAAVLSDTARRKANSLDDARMLAQRPVIGRNEQGAWPQLKALLERFDSELAQKLAGCIDSGQVDVGTLTLGVVKPAWIASHPPYSSALDSARKHFIKATDLRNARLGASHSCGWGGPTMTWPAADVSFMLLFGEYNFFTYEKGYTPVEKDVHPSDAPKLTMKSRAVVRVARAKEDKKARSKFCRVSQIAFRYRWQWVCLANALANQADVYLSSAWEDIILVTYHESTESYANETMAQGLQLRQWQDSHSSVGLATFLPATARNPTIDAVGAQPVELRNELKLATKTVYQRTGRTDLSVDWETEWPHELLEKLDRISASGWALIGSLVHSQALEVEAARNLGLRGQVIQRHDW